MIQYKLDDTRFSSDNVKTNAYHIAYVSDSSTSQLSNFVFSPGRWFPGTSTTLSQPPTEISDTLSKSTRTRFRRWQSTALPPDPEQLRKHAFTNYWGSILRQVSKLKDGWNGRGSAAPNAIALNKAEQVLRTIREGQIWPKKVQAMSGGGVAIRFTGHQKYSDVEIDNDGDIFFVTKAKGCPSEVWDQNEKHLEESLLTIEQFLRA